MAEVRVFTGVVKGKTVVLKESAELPEGAVVLVTPFDAARGASQTVLAATDAPPHVKPADVEELMRRIEEGKHPVRFANPLTQNREQ
jgi:hypothetical protein